MTAAEHSGSENVSLPLIPPVISDAAASHTTHSLVTSASSGRCLAWNDRSGVNKTSLGLLRSFSLPALSFARAILSAFMLCVHRAFATFECSWRAKTASTYETSNYVFARRHFFVVAVVASTFSLFRCVLRCAALQIRNPSEKCRIPIYRVDDSNFISGSDNGRHGRADIFQSRDGQHTSYFEEWTAIFGPISVPGRGTAYFRAERGRKRTAQVNNLFDCNLALPRALGDFGSNLFSH